MPPSRRGKVRATLNQVARKAGVSPTTASLVLSGKADQHRIAAETLLRVEQAAAELDYSPNLLVKGMQRGRTNILAFLNAFRHRDANDLYMDRLGTAVELAVGRCGYNVLVFCDFGLTPEETYRFLNGGHADGLLMFAPRNDDPLLPAIRQSRQPAVLINARDEAGCLSSVCDDAAAGMREVADTLVRLGHRCVAAIVEHGDFRDSTTRVDLLRAALRGHGVSMAEPITVSPGRTVTETVAEMLERPDRPTAIFCWRDRLAYWVLEACEALGIDVPADLSVVGYDGLHWPAATCHIAASVGVDMGVLADAAVGLLDRLICGQEAGPVEVSVPVGLSPGTTLAPAPSPNTERTDS